MAAPASAVRTVRVLVVDDAGCYLEATHALIDATPGFEWIGEAICGEDAVALAERLGPDLILMDVRMPGMGGIEAARRIETRSPGTSVILVSAGDAADFVSGVTGPTILSKQQLNRAALERLLTVTD